MNNNQEQPTEKKDPLLLDHNYDGIQELDHPLPSYWISTFVICIFFAFIYFFYYQVLGAKTLREEYQDELAAYEAKMKAMKPEDKPFDEEKFNAYLASKEELKEGEDIFVNNCVACHKELGQGDIGPNLADEFWINGDGKAPFLHHMVMNGNEVNGMPPWKEILSEDEVYHVIAYVQSIKGVKLPGAKEPQGNKYE